MRSKLFVLLPAGLAMALGSANVQGAAIVEFHGGVALEGGGPAIVHAVRSGDTSLAFGVGYFLSDGTAKAGVDYRPQTGTFGFAAGEVDQTFSILNPTIDNGTVDGTRTILITLSRNHSVERAPHPSPLPIRWGEGVLSRSVRMVTV